VESVSMDMLPSLTFAAFKSAAFKSQSAPGVRLRSSVPYI
jgi:hypothetical protein